MAVMTPPSLRPAAAATAVATRLADRVRALQDLFTHIAATRMAGVPMVRDGFGVHALGFEALPGGEESYLARLAMVEAAQRTLDVQYYQIDNDATGRTFLRALRDAALRGVRVRLLMDDLYTEEQDDLLLGLAATPNVELRLFNPFPGGRGHSALRWLFSLHEFSRVNRRMHNKLLVADGVMAVAGGRNIANEYFMRHAQANFVDLDTFATGPLVTQLEAYFDDYSIETSGIPAPGTLALLGLGAIAARRRRV